jgi:hypothetical protein
MSGPSVATIKRLFAVSGNTCAFPNCTNLLVDVASGKVTARICHIKARQPEGPRYDAGQTEAERHAFDNLLLMCPMHHDVIDSDVETYTVERLWEIKAGHEAGSGGRYELSDEVAAQLLDSLEHYVARRFAYQAARPDEVDPETLAIAREIGDRRGEGADLRNLGNAHRALGQVAPARDCLRGALAIFEEIKSPDAERVRRWLAELEDER